MRSCHGRYVVGVNIAIHNMMSALQLSFIPEKIGYGFDPV